METSSLLRFLWQSGPVVQGVLLLLLSASVFCWAIILSKWKSIQTAQKQNHLFLSFFWSGQNLETIHKKVHRFPHAPIAQQFDAAYKELQKTFQKNLDIQLTLQTIERSLYRSSQAHLSLLEKHINWLATTATAAPFIGLFGTVWGILNAFQKIGLTGQAHLASVAPGISEALFATALGLATAIPAAIAYNAFSHRLRHMSIDLECFSQDLLNIITRSYSPK